MKVMLKFGNAVIQRLANAKVVINNQGEHIFYLPSNNPKLVDEQESWVVVSIKLRQSLGEHLLFAALLHH
jgi:hypothetical protein